MGNNGGLSNYESGLMGKLADIFSTKTEPPKELWEQVKELQEEKAKTPHELGEARATMIVNFGPEGKHTKGLVTQDMSLLGMIIKVLEHFIPKKN
jgi:hypothetical protein